jgi:hypothetical protein
VGGDVHIASQVVEDLDTAVVEGREATVDVSDVVRVVLLHFVNDETTAWSHHINNIAA